MGQDQFPNRHRGFMYRVAWIAWPPRLGQPGPLHPEPTAYSILLETGLGFCLQESLQADPKGHSGAHPVRGHDTTGRPRGKTNTRRSRPARCSLRCEAVFTKEAGRFPVKPDGGPSRLRCGEPLLLPSLFPENADRPPPAPGAAEAGKQQLLLTEADDVAAAVLGILHSSSQPRAAREVQAPRFFFFFFFLSEKERGL